MINVQEGVGLEKDWIDFEEGDLRDELDRYGPFISTCKLAEILARAWKAHSTPLFHYSAGVLASRTAFQQGENHVPK